MIDDDFILRKEINKIFDEMDNFIICKITRKNSNSVGKRSSNVDFILQTFMILRKKYTESQNIFKFDEKSSILHDISKMIFLWKKLRKFENFLVKL